MFIMSENNEICIIFFEYLSIFAKNTSLQLHSANLSFYEAMRGNSISRVIYNMTK